jgi:VIT1/CCC1 family predicted Fe2+/Mn2+ transporter
VTGIILIIIEALSMAFGALVAEDSFLHQAGVHYTTTDTVKYASVMFISYVLAGCIPLLPFALSLPSPAVWSVTASLTTLGAVLHAFQRNPRKTASFTTLAACIMALGAFSGKSLA